MIGKLPSSYDCVMFFLIDKLPLRLAIVRVVFIFCSITCNGKLVDIFIQRYINKLTVVRICKGISTLFTVNGSNGYGTIASFIAIRIHPSIITYP